MRKIILKTFSCPHCGYKQDFNPSENALMAIHFPGVPKGKCPACWLGKNADGAVKDNSLVLETDPGKKIVAQVMDDAEIDLLPGGVDKAAVRAERDKSLKELRQLEDKP